MNRKTLFHDSYSPSSLRNHLKSDDFWKYNIDPLSVDDCIKSILSNFIENKFWPDSFGNKKVKSKKVFTYNSLYNALTIRRTDSILRNAFKLVILNREEEVAQILQILAHERKEECFVYRTDISSFYEKLTMRKIIDSKFISSRVPLSTSIHLNNISTHLTSLGYTGLPRGFCLSSTLSDIALLDFDKELRKLESCIYYTRYVDDIILITANKIDYFKEFMLKLLSKYDLALNSKKTYDFPIKQPKIFEYLGYKIDPNNLKAIQIADGKIKKIKTRIILSIKSFLNRDKDFPLLKNRLRFLSGTTKLSMAGRIKPIIVGIRNNYNQCNFNSIDPQLSELDTFYRGIISNSNKKYGKKLKEKISEEQMNILEKLSFKSGYINKITHSFSREYVAKIKRAWLHE